MLIIQLNSLHKALRTLFKERITECGAISLANIWCDCRTETFQQLKYLFVIDMGGERGVSKQPEQKDFCIQVHKSEKHLLRNLITLLTFIRNVLIYMYKKFTHNIY